MGDEEYDNHESGEVSWSSFSSHPQPLTAEPRSFIHFDISSTRVIVIKATLPCEQY